MHQVASDLPTRCQRHTSDIVLSFIFVGSTIRFFIAPCHLVPTYELVTSQDGLGRRFLHVPLPCFLASVLRSNLMAQ